MKSNKIEVTCLGCGKVLLKYPSKVGKNNFCSLKCRDKYKIKSKYGHLYEIFNENINEVAYLIGLIMGDGNLRKLDQKKTTRISIGFDIKHENLIKIFKKVATRLKINYFVEPKIHNNCQAIGFVLPDKLLKMYGILYSGAKYNNQPKPVDKIVNNINYAAGLINSDGWCGYRLKKYKTIGFINTVSSIGESLVQCLRCNNIECSYYIYDGYIDKRTKKKGKTQYQLRVLKEAEIDKLKSQLKYNIKEFKSEWHL